MVAVTSYAKKFPSPTPIKFQDAAEFERQMAEYFDTCCGYAAVDCVDPETKAPKQIMQKVWVNPPTLIGLANWMDCNWKTFYDLENPKMYVDNPQMSKELRQSLIKSVGRARQIIHEYTVHAALTNKSAQGPIFVLKNNFGWRDEQHITQDVTTKQADTDLSKLSTEQLTQLQQLVSLTQAEEAEYSDIPDQDSQDNLWD